MCSSKVTTAPGSGSGLANSSVVVATGSTRGLTAWPPRPLGQRRIRGDGGAYGGCGHHGSRTPLQARGKRRSELRVRRKRELIRAANQGRHPASTLVLRESHAGVPRQHLRVTAELAAVQGGPAEGLGEPRGQPVRLIDWHAREQAGQERVLGHMPLVEEPGKSGSAQEGRRPTRRGWAGHSATDPRS